MHKSLISHVTLATIKRLTLYTESKRSKKNIMINSKSAPLSIRQKLAKPPQYIRQSLLQGDSTTGRCALQKQRKHAKKFLQLITARHTCTICNLSERKAQAHRSALDTGLHYLEQPLYLAHSLSRRVACTL